MWHEKRKKLNKKTWQWTNTADSDWQEIDTGSRQRGRTTETRQQLSDKINIWSQVPQWARHQDVLTDRPSVVKWLRLQHQNWKLRIHKEGMSFYSFLYRNFTASPFKVEKQKHGSDQSETNATWATFQFILIIWIRVFTFTAFRTPRVMAAFTAVATHALSTATGSSTRHHPLFRFSHLKALI
jgi:hypothetical protein